MENKFRASAEQERGRGREEREIKTVSAEKVSARAQRKRDKFFFRKTSASARGERIKRRACARRQSKRVTSSPSEGVYEKRTGAQAQSKAERQAFSSDEHKRKRTEH